MQKIKFEYKITIAYILLGGLWIVFSDKLLNYFIDESHYLTHLQTYKGWFYVIVTALLFYLFLKKHLIKIRHAEQKARESDRLKTAFLHNISHEIRTPMNGIMGFAGLLNDGNLTEVQKKEYLAIIIQSSDRLLEIVNNVLDISLIETGNISLKTDKVQLNELLEELHSSFIHLVKPDVIFKFNKGLTGTSAVVLVDNSKLRQILKNLINNAIKFTDKGHITFGYTLNNNELEFYVEDTGIGIAPEFHDTIYERFRKSEFDISRLYDGVGLGLAISKGIVELLNGRIWVKSEKAKGSTFYFTIPYIPANPIETSTPVTDKAISNELVELTILVAEDEESNFLYIKEILEGTGIEIVHAWNGEEAVEICHRNNQINLVLMDIKMPVMNGYEAIKQIMEFRPELKFIAQTAYTVDDERKFALSAGFSDYLSKPFKKEELLKVLNKARFLIWRETRHSGIKK